MEPVGHYRQVCEVFAQVICKTLLTICNKSLYSLHKNVLIKHLYGYIFINKGMVFKLRIMAYLLKTASA